MEIANTVFALTSSIWLFVLAGLTGTVSMEVVESGPFTSLEQAMLPGAAEGHSPTRLFGTYNTIATLAGSFGALAAVGTRVIDVEPQRLLLGYPVAAVAAIVVAVGLSETVEARRQEPTEPRRPLERSRGIVARLSGLSRSTHSAAGSPRKPSSPTGSPKSGEPRPRLSASCSSPSASSGGLVPDRGPTRRPDRAAQHDRVFTHLPSNLLLALIPFAPSQRAAIALVLGRFALSQMDVPTRQAYVVAVVDLDERTEQPPTEHSPATSSVPSGRCWPGRSSRSRSGRPS